MKALSIQQPWLYAITDLDKAEENRTWSPPTCLIGKRIALHASKRDDPGGRIDFYNITSGYPPGDLPRGSIVATAIIAGYMDDAGRMVGGFYTNNSTSRWVVGPVIWVFKSIQKLPKPIPCRGQLRLWDVPPEIERLINDHPCN